MDLYEEIIGFPESVLLHGRYHDILKKQSDSFRIKDAVLGQQDSGGRDINAYIFN